MRIYGGGSKIFFNFLQGVYMKEYFNVMCPRNGKDGKTKWQNVGVAFKNDARPDIPFNIILNCVPLPEINEKGKLECRMMIMKPMDNQNQKPQTGSNNPPQTNTVPGFDDEVTF